MLELEGVSHRHVDAGGLRMHVAEAGDGPPLLLLHGWPQHWWMWRKVLPGLARSHRCIAPDLRGLGWTDAPAGGYEKRTLAADVVALLDALGIERAPVIGHDWGAVAGMWMCLDAPDRVERCLMLSVPAMWEQSYDPRRLLSVAHMPLLAAPFAERAVPRTAALLMRADGLSAAEAEPYVEVLRRPERRRATVAYYRTFLGRELPGALRHPPPRPGVPVRVAGGRRDPVCRFSREVEIVSRRAGHFLPEQDPDAVLALAREFLP